MKVGLLLCDDVMPELQPTYRNYPDMFADLLTQAEPSLQLVVYRVLDGDYPPAPESCDGYVISGSKSGVNDDEQWIRDFEQYVARLCQLKIPLVGICFGHQMIAKALGGKVERANNGWGVGVANYQLSDRNVPQWIDPALNNFSLNAIHQDQVTLLPEDATTLASSDFCPIAMFTVGKHALAVQGHPEFPSAYLDDLLDRRQDRIPPSVYQSAKQSMSLPNDSLAVAQWIIAFFRQALSELEYHGQEQAYD